MKYPPRASQSQAAGGGSDIAERELEQSAASEQSRARLLDFLRAITDNLGEGIYALDTTGCVTFMNPAAEAMLGWTLDELRGKDMHATIHFQHADGSAFPREQCPLLRVIGSGQVERIDDDAFTRRDGSLLPVSYVSAPIVTGGVVSGAVLAFHDVSAHKALDEALRRSERGAAAQASQLMAIFESMADAIIVYDRAGNIIRTNTADAELLGASDAPETPLRTLGQRDDLFTVLDERGQPSPTERWPFARVLRGEVLRGASAMDINMRMRDGRVLILNASGAPVRSADGEIVGGVLIGRDVTQRRRLEQQTREALAALMAMAETLVGDAEVSSAEYIPVDSFVGAPQVARRLAELTRVVMACRRVDIVAFEPESEEMRAVAVAGLTPDEERTWLANWPTAGHMRDFLPDAFIERLRLGEAIQIDRTQSPFNHWANPFGSRTMLVIPMRVGGRLLGNLTLDYGAADHQPGAEEFAMAGAVAKLAALIIERDRLAHDRAVAYAHALAMAETTRRMDEFLSIAAHELKTPVTNSRLVVALASDTLANTIAQARADRADAASAALAQALEPVQGSLERMESNMERLSRLVVDLLDVSRIRAGKLELREAPCDLAEIVREVVEEQRQMTPGRVIRMRLPGATSRPALIYADADRIRQVIANYLSNALRYSSDDQCVSVHLKTSGAWARVSVSDGGPGIPPDQRDLVWERFYRVQRTDGTSAPPPGVVGLGLGLHICRMIVEQHHGRVGLRNAPGGGTVFWFALLLAPAAP
jgi:PAS domain S-box-containing protein